MAAELVALLLVENIADDAPISCCHCQCGRQGLCPFVLPAHLELTKLRCCDSGDDCATRYSRRLPARSAALVRPRFGNGVVSTAFNLEVSDADTVEESNRCGRPLSGSDWMSPTMVG